MSKYTKGPWKVDGKTELCITNVDDLSRFIGSASIMGNKDNCKESYEEAKANARLMAAAPDLLEALEEIASWTMRFQVKDHPIARMAQNAIAKARGE